MLPRMSAKLPTLAGTMTPFPYSIPPGATLHEARKTMQEHGIHHLPVQRGDAILGMVATEDLLAAEARGDDFGSTADRTLILCRVTLGKALEVKVLDPDPRECERVCCEGPCHSVIGDRIFCRGTFREFVVFDDDLDLPFFEATRLGGVCGLAAAASSG